ncbi:MAG: hypothetical protein MJE63_24720 [Proteobacteria bacterium]|nr:hypothetical protein [Pseudomonadota bacterium]
MYQSPKLLCFLIVTAMITPSIPISASEKPIYKVSKSKKANFKQVRISIPFDMESKVFPIPVDDSIGTIYGNSLSLIRFEKSSYTIDVLKKNISKIVGTSSKFLPVFSDRLVGWAETRGFFLFDLKKNTHKYFKIRAVPGRWEYIEYLSVLDAENLRFLFIIESENDDYEDPDYFMKVVSFDEEKPKESKIFDLLKDGDIKRYFHSTFSNYIFFNDLATNNLEVLDITFNKTHHPIVDIYNSLSDVTFRNRFTIHPNLPFAVIEGDTKLWVVTWKKNKAEIHPIIYLPKYTVKFDFSPEGKWFFIEYVEDLPASGHKEKHYAYLMPVDSSIQYFLGDPIDLGSFKGNHGTIVWSQNPMAVNIFDFINLHRWVVEGLN